MAVETSVVPSEPSAASEPFHGYRVFEQVRRPTVGPRRCSPADNSFVAIDRVAGPSRMALLVRPAHPTFSTGSPIEADLRRPGLGAVGLEVLEAIPQAGALVVGGCPGVRLRALAEKCALQGTSWEPAVVWHLVDRTAALLEAWRRVGLTPADTFVAFDGSLHLFPQLPACARAEAPSSVGDEVWDSFLVEARPAALAQLVGGTLPEPFLPAAARAALRAAGLSAPADPAPVPPAVERLLAHRPETADASGPLADLVRAVFPAVYQRHLRSSREAGVPLEADGRARERRVLGAGPPPQP